MLEIVLYNDIRISETYGKSSILGVLEFKSNDEYYHSVGQKFDLHTLEKLSDEHKNKEQSLNDHFNSLFPKLERYGQTMYIFEFGEFHYLTVWEKGKRWSDPKVVFKL